MAFRRHMRVQVSAALLVASVSFAAGHNAGEGAVRKLLSDASGIGLPIGSLAPEIGLQDQHGRKRERLSLAGPSGLVLVFFRSADW